MWMDMWTLRFLLVVGVVAGEAGTPSCSWLDIGRRWRTGYRAQVDIHVQEDMDHWVVEAQFDEALLSFQSWKGSVSSEGGSKFKIVNKCYNGQVFSCQCFSLTFLVKYELGASPHPTFSFNHRLLTPCKLQPCANNQTSKTQEYEEDRSTVKSTTTTLSTTTTSTTGTLIITSTTTTITTVATITASTITAMNTTITITAPITTTTTTTTTTTPTTTKSTTKTSTMITTITTAITTSKTTTTKTTTITTTTRTTTATTTTPTFTSTSITTSSADTTTSSATTTTISTTEAEVDPEYYLVTGGIGETGQVSDGTIYNKEVPIFLWVRVPSLPVPEGVSGGVGGVVGDVVVQCSGNADKCWYWEPLLNGLTWKTAPPDTPRTYGAGVTTNGTLWISGGLLAASSSPLSTSLYSWSGGSLVRTAGPHLTSDRLGHCGAQLGTGVVLTGGFGTKDSVPNYLSLVEKYDIQTGNVSVLPSMNWPRMNHGCTVYSDTVIVAAGWLYGIYINVVEILQPGADQWKTVQPLPNYRLSPQMVTLEGSPYIVGGAWYNKIAGAWTYRDKVLKYDEEDDGWVEEDKLRLRQGIFRHTLVKIPHRLLKHHIGFSFG